MSEQSNAAVAAGTQEAASNDAAKEVLDAVAENAEGGDEAETEESAPISKEEKKAQAEVKKTLKKLKIKFNNKEMEEDLPFEIPDDEASQEYMRKHIQMSKLAQSKSQEYSQLEKEVQSFVEQLRKDPRKVLSNPELGLDVEKFVQDYVQQKLADSSKSPEQIAKEKLEHELKELKDKYEKEQQDFKAKEYERLKEQEIERYDLSIASALKQSDLPNSPYVVKKMANYMMLGLENGIDVDPSDVLPLVRQEIESDLKDMFAVMPDEVVEAIVGKDTISRIRKKSIAKAKQTPATSASQIKDVGASSKKEDGESNEKKMTYKEFFKF